MKKGFDNNKYVKIQSKKIKERFKLFDKLYLEVGGKLFDDSHAARILPGFKNDVKISMFKELKNDLEIIFCINAGDIEKNKTRGEYGITYDQETISLINKSKKMGFSVNSVVITLYKNQVSVDKFINKLNRNGIKTYIHTATKGYPTDVDTIVSDEGYGANPYIETTKPLILVNAPGPGSGKLATCLSQIYHENKRGVNAGYAKFETFPVWNLNLMHPVNVAYEAATVDLKDINMIDSFHLEAYGENAVSYNRDLSTFPILKNILNKITGREIYKSPTDMGVNMIKQCIIDDEVVRRAAEDEIIRRYYSELTDYKKGICSKESSERIEMMMNKLEISTKQRNVIGAALQKQEKEDKNVVAIELPNGKIITGKESELLSASSAAIINVLKEITNIPEEMYLLSPAMLEAILRTKQNTSYRTSYCLNVQEVLIAISICSSTNPIMEKMISKIGELRGCEAHSSYIIEQSELNVIKNLGINLTCEPKM